MALEACKLRCRSGWPPPEPLGRHAWNYILAEKPLSWWKKVTWSLEKHDLALTALSKDSQRIVAYLFNEHANGAPARYPIGPDSKVRLLSQCDCPTV